jgi:hypothetical protein
MWLGKWPQGLNPFFYEHDPESLPSLKGKTYHYFIAILENMERQGHAGK